MVISLNWLKEYVDVAGVSPQELGKRLSSAGFQVEKIEELRKDDVLFDLSLTPNRGDCFSILGIAREVAAIFNQPLLQTFEQKFPYIENTVIDIVGDAKHACPKFCALRVKNITVGQSPQWLKTRLIMSGMRPINTIVDSTNYIMFATGQPLHAFDAEKIKGGMITVRYAHNGETITTLDGKKRVLTPSMLVLADAKEALDVAGIIGGADSEITDATKDIILVACVFAPASIRSTYRTLGVRTEAAIRFEKGIDWYFREISLEKTAEMIEELAGGSTEKGIMRIGGEDPQPMRFDVSFDYVNNLLGTALSKETMRGLLERLEIKTEEKDLFMGVSIPSWRHDLYIPADIAEEVGRMSDYNTIIPQPLYGVLQAPVSNEFFFLKKKMRYVLKHLGFNEVYSYSFYGDQEAGFVKDASHIEVANPVTPDHKYLRYTLIPQLLRHASANLRFYDTVRIFELGRVFKEGESSTQLPKEIELLSGAISIKTSSAYETYRMVKGVAQQFLSEMGIHVEISYSRTGCYIDLSHDNTWLGQILVIDELKREEYKIRQPIVVFTFQIERLYELHSDYRTYIPIPAYPSVERDLSFMVPDAVHYKDIVEHAKEGSSFIRAIFFVDEYRTVSGQRTITIRLVYRSPERTLTGEDVDAMQKEVISGLEDAFSLKLRTSV